VVTSGRWYFLVVYLRFHSRTFNTHKQELVEEQTVREGGCVGRSMRAGGDRGPPSGEIAKSTIGPHERAGSWKSQQVAVVSRINASGRSPGAGRPNSTRNSGFGPCKHEHSMAASSSAQLSVQLPGTTHQPPPDQTHQTFYGRYLRRSQVRPD
jgi:hypothetical protein